MSDLDPLVQLITPQESVSQGPPASFSLCSVVFVCYLIMALKEAAKKNCVPP